MMVSRAQFDWWNEALKEAKQGDSMKTGHLQFITILSLALMASSPALGQRPPGGGSPGQGSPGEGRRGGPPEPGVRGDMQDPEHRPGPDHRPGPPPPFGPQADWLSSEMRFGDRLVKGAPYSAEFSTES